MQSSTFKDLGIGAALLLAGFGVYSFLKKKDNATTPGTDEFEAAALKQVVVDPKKLTKDAFNYKNTAEQVYNQLSNRSFLPGSYSYDAPTLFGYFSGLNTDELKQVAKEFGVRSLKIFNLISMADGGTLFEWFENLLTKADLEKMKTVWAGTGLWQLAEAAKAQAAFNTNLKDWMANNFSKVNYPNPRLANGKKVYSIYTGNNNWGYSDWGWWDIGSFTAKKAATGDFYVRPADAATALGTITGLYKNATTGVVALIKVKITHPKIYYTGANTPQNREVWLLPNRLTDVPYARPLSGLAPAIYPSLSNVL